jgi:hypothetical protein
VFTSDPGLIEGVRMKPGVSDHERVLFHVGVNVKPDKPYGRKIYCFNEENIGNLKEYLKNFDFSLIINEYDIDETWNDWKIMFLKCVDDYVPCKSGGKGNNMPWMNNDLRKLVRKQNRLHRLCKQNELRYKNRYKNVRTRVNYEMEKAKKSYIQGLCDNISEKPKQFWNFVKGNKNSSSGVGMLKDKQSDNMVTDDASKAEMLNNEFTSVFTHEKDNPEELSTSNNNLYNNILSDLKVTDDQVFYILRSLDTSKATGPDNISARMLKECAAEIAPSLCQLFNISLRLGRLPEDWRLSNITPLYKKGSHSDAANYRPVSITSLVSKILEKIIYKHITGFLNMHGILSDNQHGFRSNRSCETQLLSAVNDWCEAAECNKPVDVIFLDFSRAFDTVPFNRLMYKLKSNGIRGNVLNWIEHFLTERKQRVLVNDQYSSWSKVTSGVPQGTILGPLLFLVFINDICDALNCTCRLYADDCIIYRPIQGINDVVSLQMDLNKLHEWSTKWLLNFNVKKM